MMRLENVDLRRLIIGYHLNLDVPQLPRLGSVLNENKKLFPWITLWSSYTDGFVIPSLTVEDLDISKSDVQKVKEVEPSSAKVSMKCWTGCQGRGHDLLETTQGKDLHKCVKQQDLNAASRKSVTMPKSSHRDWLDPHWLENQFERSYSH
ncbi:hypothetical protein BVC80_1663g32 [Macleaya cordata]|uniref:Uncharacterized protein n=1 Tax=Macleaya cordata TaxID=56857 RepID=A0A200RBQ7_MACCD|nr:hypothetical protein BVC80_1663g32 [Macleaya cordata]